MCVVDWNAIAAWITAAATATLAVAAIRGLYVWRSQHEKIRDHDLALRILRAVSNSYTKLEDMRTPTALITDGDIPVQPSALADAGVDRDFRRMSARYRARKFHLVKVVEERTATLNEALVVWDGAYGERLADLVHELGNMEVQVSREIVKYLDRLRPGAQDSGEAPDLDILYAPADADAEDEFADAYQLKIEQIRQYLAPNIRME